MAREWGIKIQSIWQFWKTQTQPWLLSFQNNNTMMFPKNCTIATISTHLVLVEGFLLSLSSSLTLSPIKLLGPVARVAKELREELLQSSISINKHHHHHHFTLPLSSPYSPMKGFPSRLQAVVVIILAHCKPHLLNMIQVLLYVFSELVRGWLTHISGLNSCLQSHGHNHWMYPAHQRSGQFLYHIYLL